MATISMIPERLSAALSVLIRPLVRLLLQRGITYPHLIQIIRRVYVDVADREFRIAGHKQTDSRVSLLTGIHRRYVKELRAEIAERLEIPPNVSLGGQLVANWLNEERFTDRHRKPLRLPRTATGGDTSFDDLVRSVTTDIRPRVLLDELLRLGVVQLDEQDNVTLARGAFIPDTGTEEKLYFFGRNLHDHIAASAHNINGGDPPFMERSAYNGNLTADSARILAAHAESEGMRALQSVHKKASELRKQDERKHDANHRVNFGTYFYAVDSDAERELGADGD